MSDLKKNILKIGKQAKDASLLLSKISSKQKNKAIEAMADNIINNKQAILDANQKDIDNAIKSGLSESFIDRLKLDDDRINGIAVALRDIASFQDPIGKNLDSWSRPNGLNISRISTPLGVVGVIYESRPNVTADAGALCLKSGNAVILRGGTDSFFSSLEIHNCLIKGLKNSGITEHAIQIINNTNRDAVKLMLNGINKCIDVIVPRGGKNLVAEVEKEAKVPVFAHLEGICHIYVDKDADKEKTLSICTNAKMRRPGICGAVETILVHEEITKTFFKSLLSHLSNSGCEIRGCKKSIDFYEDIVPASEDDWITEYLAPIVSIKIVKCLDDAIKHIEKYSSGHTESILTEDLDAAGKFQREIDSAIVMHNTSTQFADGGEFGLGGEIGISTGKFHARGPVGIDQLTSFKYVVKSDGQIRK